MRDPAGFWRGGVCRTTKGYMLSEPGVPASSALTKFPNGAQRFFNGRPVEDNLQLNTKQLGSVKAQPSSTEP